MRTFVAVCAIAATFAEVGNALAQTYPSRPITMVVPFAPGGPTDTIARIIAEHMRGSLGQPVGAVYSLRYDLIGDFAPIALLSFQPMLIVARKSMPANDLKELVVWLKAHAGKATLGIQGVGTAGHVFGVFFQKEIDAALALVPYRGASPAMQDLVAGQIDFMIDTPTNSLPQVHAGSIKAYAVTAESRLPSAPEIPTVDEAGLPGFHFSFWQALWAPKYTPNAIIDQLNAAVVATLADPTIRQRFAEQGHEIPPLAQQTPQALAAYHKAQIDQWWPIVRSANIKAE